MNTPIDMAGKIFGRWTVLSYVGDSKWKCRCECGCEKAVEGKSLRRGISQGCISCHTRTRPATKHGGKHTRLYNIWCGMKTRCYNVNDVVYPRYGGRGITICDEWRADFDAFRDWSVANGYTDSLTIDRYPDNSGNYEPGNCRWATYAEQSRNHSRNRPIEFRGRTVLICDLAAEVGLPQDILKNRILRYGWDVERAVSEPVAERIKHEPWIEAGMSKSSWYRARKAGHL